MFTGVTLLALLVPMLISYLLEEKSLSSASKPSRTLHDEALQKIMKIGPLYQEQFRSVMGMAADLKPRLEAAVKINQAALAKAKAQQVTKITDEPAKPTITLKTNFSNFTG